MYRELHNRFSTKFRTSEGHQFKGELGNPNAYPRPRKELQNLPHRALVTHRISMVKPGDLVTAYGVNYLLCGQHVLASTKRFLAVEVNSYLTWKRLDEVIDPITQLPRDSQEVVLDPVLPVVIEPQRAFEEQRFSQSQDRLFTAADVQPGDLLGDYKVNRVDDLMGLKLVEVV